jgi:hypothetical protein
MLTFVFWAGSDFEIVFANTRAAAWQAHAHEQLLAWLGLTPQQRLDWLWQAKLFARRAQEAAAERAAGRPSLEAAAPPAGSSVNRRP